MKHLVSTILLVIAAAGVTGFVAFRTTAESSVARALTKQDAMEWLRADFELTDAQFAAIKQLHDAYSVTCEEHCREIIEAAGVRNRLTSSLQTDAAALAAADRRVEELRTLCESALDAHIRRCASHMSPEAGQRYLALVLPKIKDFDHLAAPNIQLSKHGH